MAEPVGSLHVAMSAGHAQIKEDLGKAQAAVRTFSARSARAMAAVGKSFSGVLGKMTMFHKLTLAAGVTAFGAIIKNAINTADRLGKLSEAVGVSTETLSTLMHTAKLSGASMEEFSRGVRNVARNAVAASKGTGEFAAIFQGLKVELEDGEKNIRPVDDLILDLADKFATMSNGAEKVTLAAKLFGQEAGPKLVPMLNQGRDGIEELRAEFVRLNMVVTTQSSDAAQQFGDQMTMLQGQASAVGLHIGLLMLPKLFEVAAAMTAASREGTVLAAVWAGLAKSGEVIFLGSELQQAEKQLKDLRDLQREFGEEAKVAYGQHGWQRTPGGTTLRDQVLDQLIVTEQLRLAERQRAAEAKRLAKEAMEKAKKDTQETSKQLAAALEKQRIDREAEAQKARLLNLGEQSISDLQREIDLSNAKTRAVKLDWELQHGRFADLSEAHKEQLRLLSAELDVLDRLATKKAEQEAAEAERDALVRAQRTRANQLIDETLTKEERHARQLKEINDLLKAGELSAEQYFRVYWKLHDAMKKTGDGVGDQARQFDALGMAIDRSAAALADFATGGKVSFADLARSIVRDLIRIELQTQLTSLFRGTDGGTSLAGRGFTWARSITGRAGGGPVRPRSMYEVNERGPEMLSMGNRHFLMMAGQSGYVTPTESSLPATAERTPQSIRVVNVLDPALVNDWAASAAGEKVIVNAIARHATQLRAMLS